MSFNRNVGVESAQHKEAKYKNCYGIIPGQKDHHAEALSVRKIVLFFQLIKQINSTSLCYMEIYVTGNDEHAEPGIKANAFESDFAEDHEDICSVRIINTQSCADQE